MLSTARAIPKASLTATIKMCSNTSGAGKGLSEIAIRDGYQNFKSEKAQSVLIDLASRHRLARDTLHNFVSGIRDRVIFDRERLSYLLEPLGLGWRARNQAEAALMAKLNKQIGERENVGVVGI